MNFPGNCFYKHDEKKMWIEIPKNASKSISHHLLRMKWKNGNYIEDKTYDYEAIIVVRDVIDRWKGSTLEICYHHAFHNKFDLSKFEPWFFSRDWKNFVKRGDIHHQPLSYFCKNLTNPHYIAMDSNFDENVKNSLGITNLKTINSTKENTEKLKLKPYVDELLTDQSFLEKLYDYYKEDQELFLAASSRRNYK
jgi:hypothetical protein